MSVYDHLYYPFHHDHINTPVNTPLITPFELQMIGGCRMKTGGGLDKSLPPNTVISEMFFTGKTVFGEKTAEKTFRCCKKYSPKIMFRFLSNPWNYLQNNPAYNANSCVS